MVIIASATDDRRGIIEPVWIRRFPDGTGDSWKVVVMQEGSVDDAERRQMIEEIAARLKAEYDLKG